MTGAPRRVDASAIRQDPNALNYARQTPLHIAAFKGNVAEAKLLLSHPSCEPGLSDAHTNTALHYAAAGGHAEIVSALLMAGADPEAVTTGNTAVRIRGSTALHVAASSASPGATDVLRALLDNPYRVASIEAVDNEGLTPLACAVRGNLQASASVLLEHGADPWAITLEHEDGFAKRIPPAIEFQQPNSVSYSQSGLSADAAIFTPQMRLCQMHLTNTDAAPASSADPACSMMRCWPYVDTSR